MFNKMWRKVLTSQLVMVLLSLYTFFGCYWLGMEKENALYIALIVSFVAVARSFFYVLNYAWTAGILNSSVASSVASAVFFFISYLTTPGDNVADSVITSVGHDVVLVVFSSLMIVCAAQFFFFSITTIIQEISPIFGPVVTPKRKNLFAICLAVSYLIEAAAIFLPVYFTVS